MPNLGPYVAANDAAFKKGTKFILAANESEGGETGVFVEQGTAPASTAVAAADTEVLNKVSQILTGSQGQSTTNIIGSLTSVAAGLATGNPIGAVIQGIIAVAGMVPDATQGLLAKAKDGIAGVVGDAPTKKQAELNEIIAEIEAGAK